MQIKFELKGTKVLVKIYSFVPHLGDRVWTLDLERGNEVDAALLYQSFSKNMDATLNSIRRDEYEQGWLQAKSKKGAKKDWFGQGWRT